MIMINKKQRIFYYLINLIDYLIKKKIIHNHEEMIHTRNDFFFKFCISIIISIVRHYFELNKKKLRRHRRRKEHFRLDLLPYHLSAVLSFTNNAFFFFRLLAQKLFAYNCQNIVSLPHSKKIYNIFIKSIKYH